MQCVTDPLDRNVVPRITPTEHNKGQKPSLVLWQHAGAGWPPVDGPLVYCPATAFFAIFDLSTIRSGVRADPVHGVSPAGGAEGISQHASIHLPGTVQKMESFRVDESDSLRRRRSTISTITGGFPWLLQIRLFCSGRW